MGDGLGPQWVSTVVLGLGLPSYLMCEMLTFADVSALPLLCALSQNEAPL